MFSSVGFGFLLLRGLNGRFQVLFSGVVISNIIMRRIGIYNVCDRFRLVGGLLVVRMSKLRSINVCLILRRRVCFNSDFALRIVRRNITSSVLTSRVSWNRTGRGCRDCSSNVFRHGYNFGFRNFSSMEVGPVPNLI